MKINISIHLLVVLVLVMPTLYGATHVVLPGDSVQDTINTASAGDMIILKGGVISQTWVVQTSHP